MFARHITTCICLIATGVAGAHTAAPLRAAEPVRHVYVPVDDLDTIEEAYKDMENPIRWAGPEAIRSDYLLSLPLAGPAAPAPRAGRHEIQVETDDMPTTYGSALFKDFVSKRNATIVDKMKAAGAIILAKANMGEYAGGDRSSFGGTFCNPYDTEREPGMSSAGSATAVAANLVTCAIGEETVVSIRWPAAVNSIVGLAPTQELVSRHGMMGSGLTMRTGPMCRTVEDAARVLDVIAGYDPRDEMTVFSVGRTPAQPYGSFASAQRLDGVRIGVIREYMDRTLLSRADEQSLDLVERALDDLRRLGATLVDPDPAGRCSRAASFGTRRSCSTRRSRAGTRSCSQWMPAGNPRVR